MAKKLDLSEFGGTPQLDLSEFQDVEKGSLIRRAVADKAIGFASGAVGATKAIADAAGADNAVSSYLGDANTSLTNNLSAEAKADQATQSQILESAKGKGVWENVKAGARAFAEAPVQASVQGLGSIVPVLAGGIAGLPGAVATGVAMGAGTVKGSIFDDVKRRSLEAGKTEAEATLAAEQAQQYGGANTDQIAIGGALGGADAATGVGRIAGGMLRNALGQPVKQVAADAIEHGLLRRAGMGMLEEMPLEAAQGGQEQLASNIAAQRAGFDAGTWDNVASQATFEALASAGPGAAFGSMDTPRKMAAPAPAATPEDLDAANAELGAAVNDYSGIAPDQQRLGYNNVITVPRQDGMGSTTIDRTTGPLSAAAADAVEGGLTADMNNRVGALLKSYPSTMDAQAELDQREDADRMQIISHPRATGRFAITPKNAQALAAMDQKSAANTANQLRAQQVEEEDGNAAAPLAPTEPTIDDAANEAATSNLNPLMQPTDGQKRAGNYTKGHTNLGGLDIAIENPAGSWRSGVDSDGVPWKNELQHHYGYVKGTVGNDGDHVDMFIKPGTPLSYSGNVFVVDQVHPGTSSFDEHKVMVGFDTAEEAKAAYLSNYANDWTGMSAVSEVPYQQFKSWAKDGVKSMPFAQEMQSTLEQADQQAVAQDELVQPQAQPAAEMPGFKAMGERMANAARTAAQNRAASLAEQEAIPAEPKKVLPIKVKTALDPKAAQPQQDPQSAAGDAALDEISKSTGKLSKRRDGETTDQYQARRAEEVNKARAERVVSQGMPTQSSDVQAVRDAIGDQAADVSIADEAELPSIAEAGAGKLSKQGAEFIRHVSKLFGKRVVFVRGMKVDGFWHKGNTVYLSTDSSVNSLRVLGHEMTHTMKAQSRKSYNHMMDALKGHLTDKELTTQYKDYFGKDLDDVASLDKPFEGSPSLREFLAEEWLSDLSGNRFAESGFWQDVFERVEAKHGKEAAKGIIAKLRMAITNALNKLMALANGGQFSVDERMVDHLEQVRTALAEGFADYAQAAKNGQLSESSGDAKFSTGSNVDEVLGEDGKRQYKLDIERGDRSTSSRSAISLTEVKAIADGAAKLGLDKATTAKLIQDAKDIRKRFPVKDGWAAIEAVGVEAKKDDDGNIKLDKKGNPQVSVGWKPIGYGFNVPAGKDRAPPKLDTELVRKVATQFTKMVDDIYARAKDGNKNAQVIVGHQTWYRNVAAILRREFGAQGDLFADLLGATSPNTPVDTNWRFSIEVLKRFVRGEFDTEMAAFQKHMDAGGSASSFPGEKIRQASGKLYGMNSKNSMLALSNLWRSIEKGTAPKARNFALNLIGQSNMATIDVWAARMLRRAANEVRGMNLPRIPTVAEQGVSGTWNASVSAVTGEFGFGAAVLEEVSSDLAKKGIDLSPPDLQALAWFAEKELWTEKNWTSAQGEGGSFEENIESTPTSRYIMGFSVQQGDAQPDGKVVTDTQVRLLSTLRGDDSVISARALPTYGLFMGKPEEALDLEWTTEKGKFDPSMLLAEASKVAKERTQMAIFMSRVLQPNEDSSNARPGAEVYFKRSIPMAKVRAVMDAFNQKGLDGFTLAVDPRVKPSARPGEEFIGLRIQYVPEFDDGANPGNVEQLLTSKKQELNDVVAELSANGDVAFAATYMYDTDVVSGENYDAYIDRGASGGDRQTGSQVRAGQSVRQRLEGAAARIQSDAGPDGAGRVSDAVSSVPKSSSKRAGDGSGRDESGRTAGGSVQASERAVSQEGRLAPLAGAPEIRGFRGPDPRLVSVAEQYARSIGISLKRQSEYVQIDEGRAKRLAAEYAKMAHAPQDPKVKEAYQNLIKQTTAQYRALERAGYKFWFMDMSKPSNVEYASTPWNAMRDIRSNKEMGVFPTEDGFGSNADFDPANNPLLEDTGIKWPSGSLDGPKKRVLANDLFRAVHDAFGHGLEGSGFRAQGEENAWQAHARLFTGSAVGAITSETRGQNSWLNYGPNGESNRTAKVEDTVFADQKTGLMPEWTWTEGRTGDAKMSAARQPFYSGLSQEVGKLKMQVAPAFGWKDAIKGMVNKGLIKQDEVEWTGLNDWLDLQTGKVTRDQVMEYLNANGVQVKESTLSDTRQRAEKFEKQLTDWAVAQENNGKRSKLTDEILSGASSEATLRIAKQQGAPADVIAMAEGFNDALSGRDESKYSQYTLPGGENYREVLLTLPVKKPNAEKIDWDADRIEQKREALLEMGFTKETINEGRRLLAKFDGDIDSAIRSADRTDDADVANMLRGMSRGAKTKFANDSVPTTYQSSHWSEPNVLAHIRINDRTDADGNKVLFVEEVQSDWGQDGKKKGFANASSEKYTPQVAPGERRALIQTIKAKAIEKLIAAGEKESTAKTAVEGMGNALAARAAGMLNQYMDLISRETEDTIAEQKAKSQVPTAPFVTKTESWINLALKRIITMAVDGGYDKVAFVNGEQSADRYDLSKQVSEIKYRVSGDDNYRIEVMGRNGSIPVPPSIDADGLEQYVGKEIAQKIVSTATNENQMLRGLDLKVGGEGMKTFYDKIVPNAVSALLKKTGGGKSEVISLPDSQRGRDLVAAELDDGRAWGVYDRNEGRWLMDQDGRETFVDAEDADSYSEGAAKKMAAAIMRDAGSMLQQPGFTITPAMQEKASGGLPMFSKRRIVGDQGRSYTPEQLAAFDNIGARVQDKTVKERFNELIQDAGKKMAQGIADQFAPVKDLDGKAYGLLRLAKGSSGSFEALMKGGKLKITDGAYDFDTTARGGVVDRLLKPLGLEHHDFFRWIAANRAESLKQVGKEHLFTQKDIAALKTLASGQTNFDFTLQNGPKAGQVTRNRAEIYADSLVTFNGFNKNILDMAEQSGLIDGSTRHLWEGEFYVPFYRVADDADGGVRGMNIKGAAVRQQAFKALKGGKQALNADLMDNVLMNWVHLLDASAKNRAAKATIEAAEKMGIALGGNQTALAQMGSTVGNKNGVVWFMDGGQKRYSLIDNTGDGPYIMTALTSLEYAGMRNPVMNAMGAMKHALTVGVTASPFFKVRNLIRDTVQVVGTGPISYNVAKNLKDGWKATDPKSDKFFRLLAGGGTIHFGAMLEGSESKRIQALVESGVDASTILNNPSKVTAFYNKVIKPGLSAYNGVGDRLEAVNRAALYDQLTGKGVGHAEAALQARDLMDFSMQGSWTSVRFLTQVVPFMNARIQGLYKLGKAAKEDPARFSAVIGATALLSLGLLAAYGDDDDWKKRTESDRNNFWWFKVGGVAYRIPKPFEVGAIGTLAERGFELMFDKEMTDKRFLGQVVTLLGDNLAMNPIPQLVKPIMDVYANKDGYSGSPIESMSMERLKSEYRFNDRTSMTARGASTALNAVTGLVNKETLSPVQIDYMLHGYFGWLGAMTVTAGDVLARPSTGQAKQATPDWLRALTGNMASDLRDAPSRYVSQMYDQARVLEQAYGTWRQLQKEGKMEEAQEFRKDNEVALRQYPKTEAAKKSESLFNNMIRMVERNREMSADEKRERIRKIQIQKNEVAKRLALS